MHAYRRVVAGAAIIFMAIGIGGCSVVGSDAVRDEWSVDPVPVEQIRPVVKGGWGPERTLYTWEAPSGHTALNSISNNPVQGFEPNFFQIREKDASNATYADSITLEVGHEYVGNIYYENSVSPSVANGSTVNARVRVDLPAGLMGAVAITGYLSADNSVPPVVYDTVVISSPSSTTPIALKVVPESATLHTGGLANGLALDTDELFAEGALLGCDVLDGRINGEAECSGYITFRFRVDQPPFTVATLAGDGQASIEASPGDTVDVWTRFENTAALPQEGLAVRLTTSPGVTLVPGSILGVRDGAASTPTLQFSETNGSADVSFAGPDGRFEPGDVQFVLFEIRLDDQGEFRCGNRWLFVEGAATSVGITAPSSLIVNVRDVC
jgi:hypothetical protein